MGFRDYMSGIEQISIKVTPMHRSPIPPTNVYTTGFIFPKYIYTAHYELRPRGEPVELRDSDLPLTIKYGIYREKTQKNCQ